MLSAIHRLSSICIAFTYLYRIHALDWLGSLFGEVWIPKAVAAELEQGRQRGYDTPDPAGYPWLRHLENPDRIILLDDALARRVAQAAGLTTWGTLRILLEAKTQGLTESIKPLLDRLVDSGMWLSDDIRRRILDLAGENDL